MDPETKMLAADAIAGAAPAVAAAAGIASGMLQKTPSTLFSGLVGWPL